MKKLFLLAAALLITAGAFAQNQPQFGVKGGLNLASESGDDGGSTESRVGVHLGFFMETQIARMVDFQPELLYSTQGGESQGVLDKFDYINVPLMFKFYTGQARRFSIDAGPQLGYLISAKYIDDGDAVNIYDHDGLKKFDASLGVGVSYKFNGGFDIGIRFLAGMTKMYEGLENKNSVVQIGAGYRF
ncbi:MAG: PorT family protein [Rikenellaceae bacterium]|jgi:hypothetical protein|nr:PorT family protein [Rikenellaceae bacterium]